MAEDASNELNYKGIVINYPFLFIGRIIKNMKDLGGFVHDSNDSK